MPAPSPLAPFLDPLERLGLPYCITGSVAASVYGEPRLTADIDVVLLLGTADLVALRAAFPDGAYYVPPDETLRPRGVDRAAGVRDRAQARAPARRRLGQAPARPLHPATELDRSFLDSEIARLGLQEQWRRCQP
jgi:hypothetical protein